MREISWVAERLLGSEFNLLYAELVIYSLALFNILKSDWALMEPRKTYA
jgi:hypothetical protein